MTFGSLFDGIYGFGLACERAGMTPAFRVEIDKTCNDVTEYHRPGIASFKDVREFNADSVSVRPDLITAGWPCQDLSVAGRRAGLAGERSGLWKEVVRILADFTPRGFLGENVPGLLSACGCGTCAALRAFKMLHQHRNGGDCCGCPRCHAADRVLAAHNGRDFYRVLAELADLGYGTAYRVLDAQWFGVPQRRRRVFIVGCLGDWRRAAEVLFERESLPWDSPPRREARAGVAASLTRGTESSGRGGYAGRRREDDVNLIAFGGNNTKGAIDVATCCNAKNSASGRLDFESETFITAPCLRSNPYNNSDATMEAQMLVAHSLRAEGHDASEDGTGRGTPLVMDMRQLSRGDKFTNNRTSGGPPGTGIGNFGDPSPTIADSHTPAIFQGRSTVRRLTPRETERLQGFPDDWTRYRPDGTEISDSARYRMVGNSVAVPCVAWIARRILDTETPCA